MQCNGTMISNEWPCRDKQAADEQHVIDVKAQCYENGFMAAPLNKADSRNGTTQWYAMSNQWNDLMEQKTFGFAYRISIANTKPFVEASDR